MPDDEEQPHAARPGYEPPSSRRPATRGRLARAAVAAEARPVRRLSSSRLQPLLHRQRRLGDRAADVVHRGRVGSLRAHELRHRSRADRPRDRASGRAALVTGRPHRRSLQPQDDRADFTGTQRRLLARARGRFRGSTSSFPRGRSCKAATACSLRSPACSSARRTTASTTCRSRSST